MTREAENLKGWISLHRKIQAHWLWHEPRKFSKFEAWMDLLMNANHERTWWAAGKRCVERGNLVTSELKLARRWGWDRKTVRRFLERLEDDGMIRVVKRDKQYTEIAILNYDKYQENTINRDNERDNEKDNDMDNVKPRRSKREGKSRDNGRGNGEGNDVPINNKLNKEIKNIHEMGVPEFLNLLVEMRKQNSPVTMKQYGIKAVVKARDNFEAAVLEGVDRQALYEAVRDNPELEPWNIVKKAKQAAMPQPQFARAGDDW